MSIIYSQGTASVTVAAAGSIAVYTAGEASVYQLVGYPNFPQTKTLLAVVSGGQTVFGPYTSGAQIVIDAGAASVTYTTGVAPTTAPALDLIQGAPGTLNATGALTAALMVTGIVTSTTAAAVAGTVPTGTVLDAAYPMAVGGYFDWSLINTGANTFTVTAATDHTLVGVAAVVTVTSALFRTRKTAANTFVTYRLS